MNPRYARAWLVVTTVMSVLSIAGLADAVVAWVKFFQVVIDTYQAMTRYPIKMINDYLDLAVPYPVADYFIISALAREAAEGTTIIQSSGRGSFFWFQTALGVFIILLWPIWLLYILCHYAFYLFVYLKRASYLFDKYGSIYSSASPMGPLTPIADLHMKVLKWNIAAHLKVIFYFIIFLAVNTIAVQVHQKL